MALHTLDSCPVPPVARVDLAALGDFTTTNHTSASLSLAAQSARLEFPPATQALEARAHADATDQTYIGYGERASGTGSGLDFLLWPEGTACELFRAHGYPGKSGGEAVGYAKNSGLLLVAGSNEALSFTVVGALTFDSRTGDSRLVDPPALWEPRAFATVSEFGSKLLVAGGEDPIHDEREPAKISDTAEVYDPTSRRFEENLLKLVEASTEHAATTLLSGETVLVGGRIAASEASNLIQILSPSSARAKLAGTLRVGRRAPTLLRLSDGRLFVAGGYDASGAPVAALEWRASDASPLDAPLDGTLSLPARFDRAFAALPGGAVLAVGGCIDRAPAVDEDCTIWCQHGCPPLPDADTAQRYDAYWISATGALSRLDFPIGAGHPILLPGSDGRPWLIANGANEAGKPRPDTRALYRFDPWHQAFARVPWDLNLEPGEPVPRFVAIGTDAFVWLSPDAEGPILRGTRLGTRSAFSNDVALVVQRDAEDATRPAHLAPDHPPGTSVTYDSDLGAVTFAPATSPADTPCVWITDAEYANFSAEIDFSGAFAPSLRLGPAIASDSASSAESLACTLPAFDQKAAPGGTILLERAGNRLSLRLGATRSDCVSSSGRLPFAVCASELGATRVTRLLVTRAD